MNKKIMLALGFIIMIVFIVISSYFWYKFFLDLGSDGEITVNGKKHYDVYLNDKNRVHTVYSEETNDNVDGYEFHVGNSGVSTAKYRLLIVKLDPSKVRDGCTKATTIDEYDLNYELYFNEVMISGGVLSNVKDGILDEKTINIDEINNYELKVWLNSNVDNFEGMHYHYEVDLEVIE